MIALTQLPDSAIELIIDDFLHRDIRKLFKFISPNSTTTNNNVFNYSILSVVDLLPNYDVSKMIETRRLCSLCAISRLN